MKIFFSWSGKLSHDFAVILSNWLATVMPTLDTFLSSSDILPGSRWSNKVADELEDCSVGIICITQENIRSPWINFEAGALSKHIEESKVIPILVDLQNDDLIKSPLSQFQTLSADENDLFKLLETIFLITNIKNDRINEIFEKWYPDLKEMISNLNIGYINKKKVEDKYDKLLNDFNLIRQDLDVKVKSINNILSDITSVKGTNYLVDEPKNKYKNLEGVWRNKDGKSIYYATFIEGEMYLPYLYGGYIDYKITCL